MSKLLVAGLLFCSLVFSFGCGSTPSANSAAVNSNSNAAPVVKIDPANMPPGISANAVPPSTNTTPGIPGGPVVLPKGGTPTPGIPSEAERKKPFKPGATPTPGIPDEATRKRQMNILQNVNMPPGNSDAPTMTGKGRRRPPGQP